MVLNILKLYHQPTFTQHVNSHQPRTPSMHTNLNTKLQVFVRKGKKVTIIKEKKSLEIKKGEGNINNTKYLK